MKHLDVDRRKNRLTMAVLLAGLVLLSIVVTGLCGYKIQELRGQMEQELHRHLIQTFQEIHAMVSTRVDDTTLALRTAADVVAVMESPAQIEQYLNMVAERYGFLHVGILSSDGILTDMAGVRMDLAGEPFVRQALEGDGITFGLHNDPIDGLPRFIYTVPLSGDEVQAGILVVSSALETARDCLRSPGTSGDGCSAIVDGKGQVVLVEENAHGLDEGKSFYSIAEPNKLDRMQHDLTVGQGGMGYFVPINGEKLAVMYERLDQSEWYLISVVPVAEVSGSLERLITVVVVIDIVMVTLFLALIVAVVLLSHSNLKRIEEVAFVDPVTGGPSRAGFEERAGALMRAAPPGTYVMVSMDLDRFKLINETFGTDHGDKTLAHVYRSVASQLEKGEVAGRLSADVFNILMKNAEREELSRRLSAMATKVNEFNAAKKQKYFLPLYQGVYVVQDPAMDIITAQDRANAARKSNGKIRQGRLNACVFYDDVFGRVMRREKEIDDRVESALESGEFVIYLQPKVELSRNTAVGAEALVRWIDPARGLIPPDEFIRIFERNGFIIRLDLYVFEQVCRLLRRWLDEGRKVIPISVNLSRVHMENEDFLKAYERVRAKYGVPAELLEFELTESVVIGNMQALRGVMDQMHHLGFRCSLDDFGSGYSSLNVLKDMPVDTIKLDRVFFSGREEDERGEHVVQSVLDLARKLSIETVCEGVEELRQVEFLRAAQCDMVQGFVFSRPVPVAEFEVLAFGGKPMAEVDSKPPTVVF